MPLVLPRRHERLCASSARNALRNALERFLTDCLVGDDYGHDFQSSSEERDGDRSSKGVETSNGPPVGFSVAPCDMRARSAAGQPNSTCKPLLTDARLRDRLFPPADVFGDPQRDASGWIAVGVVRLTVAARLRKAIGDQLGPPRIRPLARPLDVRLREHDRCGGLWPWRVRLLILDRIEASCVVGNMARIAVHLEIAGVSVFLARSLTQPQLKGFQDERFFY